MNVYFSAAAVETSAVAAKDRHFNPCLLKDLDILKKTLKFWQLLEQSLQKSDTATI